MRLLATMLAVALAVVGCSQSADQAEITETREVAAPEGAAAPAAASSAERFGFRNAAAPTPAAAGYRYTVPEGWKELPPTQFRLANFTAGDNGEVEVYLSKAGGGLAANVNRWRNQLGLPPLSEQELAQLPRQPVLGQEAVFVNWEGTYGGMQGTENKANYRLAGVLLEKNGEGVFVKAVGPAEAVQKEVPKIEAFAKSLQEGAPADPHAGMMAVGGDPHAGMTPEQIQALQADPISGALNTQLTWKAPESWQQGPERPMRAVTYKVGENAEAYVAVLGGAAGGAAANINRWRGQMGVDQPLSPEEVANLPKIEVMGKQCPVVEVSGSFQGMGGEAQQNALLLGTVCELPDQTVFVKMTGPEAVVRENKDEFMTFSQSLSFTQPASPHGAAPGAAEPQAAAPEAAEPQAAAPEAAEPQAAAPEAAEPQAAAPEAAEPQAAAPEASEPQAAQPQPQAQQ